MGTYYYYSWGFFLWPLFFFFLLWGTYAWWPDRWSYRGRNRHSLRYGYADDWEYPRSREYWRAEGKHRGRGPRGYRRSDDRIAEDINDRLLLNGDIDAIDVLVKVESGIVTLSGRVENRNEKRIAEWLAEDISGVVDIKNELRVGKEQTSGTEKAA